MTDGGPGLRGDDEGPLQFSLAISSVGVRKGYGSVSPGLFSGTGVSIMRWIWIDKFLVFRSGEFARAIKNLTLAEEHLHDHFPGYPVMPASLIIEGLAQTGGILVGEAGGFTQKVVLAKIPRADFFGVACAGDQLIYEVTLTDLRSEGAVVRGKAFLEGELLADAEIVFANLDNTRANQIFGPKNFVFTQQLLGVLDLAKAQNLAREAAAAIPAADSNGQAHE